MPKAGAAPRMYTSKVSLVLMVAGLLTVLSCTDARRPIQSNQRPGIIRLSADRTAADHKLARYSSKRHHGQEPSADVAATPPMGYNTWNAYGTNIDEDLIKHTANLMVDLGLVESGYTYLNLDDAWHDMLRDPVTKELKPHPTRFASGIPHLVQYAQDKGMKLGLYTDVGVFTCAGYPGSLGYELVDANTFVRWGISYLKVDNCWADPNTVVARYTTMGDALRNVSSMSEGTPILYSLCSWGVGQPWRGWGRNVGGNTWRIDDDIVPTWRDILRCADSAIGLSRFGGPGGWSDPDMLEVGNGDLRPGMQRAHFALWCVLKAPLLIGTNLSRIDAHSLEVLKAPELIAINQDPLGVPGDLVWAEGLLQVWAAPLSGGGRAVVIVNRQQALQPHSPEFSVMWSMLGYSNTVQVTVRDAWARQDLAHDVAGSYTVTVPSADAVVLTLTPDSASDADTDSWRPWHTNSRVVATAKAARRQQRDADADITAAA